MSDLTRQRSTRDVRTETTQWISIPPSTQNRQKLAACPGMTMRTRIADDAFGNGGLMRPQNLRWTTLLCAPCERLLSPDRQPPPHPRLAAHLLHNLRAPRKPELLENVVNVVFDRRHAQTQLGADLLIRQPVADQRRDLAL